MTDTYELVGSIRKNLTTISDRWDDMLEPGASGGIAKAPTGKVTLAPDHAETDADTPRIERLLSLRREVVECLNAWTRLIIEERTITTTIPNGSDAHAMTTFLNRHAEWLAEHPAADEAHREIRHWAGKVRAASAMPEFGAEHDEFIDRSWAIGQCPVTLDDGTTCGAKIRAKTGYDTIRCRKCGTTEPLDWWMAQLMPEAADLATADNVIACVAARTWETVTHEQIRQWATRGFIQRHGRDTKGRTLYSSAAVLAYVENKAKEVPA